VIFQYLEAGPLAVNCYLIGDEATREAVVVDPGGDADRILALLKENRLRLTKIINTHCHFDHTGGNAELALATGATIWIHPAEQALLAGTSGMSLSFGIKSEPSPAASGFLQDGDVVQVGSIALEVLHTPGHSPGGICLKIRGQDLVIVGDALFQLSIGRTDFPGGDSDTLIRSIKEKLFPLGDHCQVYPGHGPPTLIGRERKFNPFLNEPSPLT
jgi:hydroxyacylglutathione hydrolase